MSNWRVLVALLQQPRAALLGEREAPSHPAVDEPDHHALDRRVRDADRDVRCPGREAEQQHPILARAAAHRRL
jgi:hypothetical protein